MNPTGTKAALLVCAIATLASCATTQLEAQWVDPRIAPGTLHGARILFTCEAAEVVIRQLCQDHLAAELAARGATAMPLPRGNAPTSEAYAQAAREIGAAAILVERVVPYSTSVSQGVSFGIGGFGYGGGGGGAAVGISAPLGGGQVTTGYAADTHLTEAASGRLLWTAKASSPPSADLQIQIQELARAVFNAADKSGVF